MPFKNKEDLIKNGKKYYSKNRIGVRLYQKEYRLRTLEEEKARHRRNNIKQYGITESDYLKMFEDQKGVCLICSLPQLTKRLHIDHCHKKNKVRGLLCENCNRGLGMFKDSPEILKLAIEYLNKNYE